MSQIEEQRAEERAALERERRAFERKQAAFYEIAKQFYPAGNGQLDANALAELAAADAEWQVANAEVERILEEIKTGKRR